MDERILAWVDRLPERAEHDIYPPLETTRKRKIASRRTLASPPPSLTEAKAGGNSNMTSMTPQKRRLEGALFDPDAPPRLGSRSLPSNSGSISRSASEASFVSRTSSPKKQKMSLRLGEMGVEYHVLRDHVVPAAAKKLFTIIEDIGEGRNILPSALKSTIAQKFTDQRKDPDRWVQAFKPEAYIDKLPGRIPSFEEMNKVLIKAIECEGFEHEEVGWNGQVHLRLLESIFDDVLGRQCDDFNTMSCTTARPHRRFLPMASTAKMIDICVYASLDQNQEFKAAVTEFSKITPTLSINHTDFYPLQFRPLLLSIETNKPGVEWEKARLQIGVWHASQWAFLRWTVGQNLIRQRLTQSADPPTTDEGGEFKAEKLAALSKLAFIPGIIVQGNDWYFVFSTYDNGKTHVYASCFFGSTKNLKQIYSIIAGVRELTAWARDVYLPWFKENILAFD
ncbi:hypothetical protein ACQKWADRAFT_301975 [Trichoderma austrokoningii]